MTRRGEREAKDSGVLLRPSVVVVDDEPLVLDALAAVLEAEVLRVTKARDFEGALEAIERHRPHVVVTDLHLRGGRGGVALAAHLRASPDARETGLIAISGVVEPEWPLVREFDAYLRKPVDRKLLVALVRQLAGIAAEKRPARLRQTGEHSV